MLSDVPLGVWSSGGLDSSAVVHYAAQHHPALKTFSVSFRGRSFDESRWFREIAASYGTDHQSSISTRNSSLRPRSSRCRTTRTSLPPTRERCRFGFCRKCAGAGYCCAQRRGRRRTLWWLQHVPRRFICCRPSADSSTIRRFGAAAAQLLPVSDEKIGLDYKVRRMLQGSLLNADEAHFFWNGTFSSGQRQALLAEGLFRNWPPLISGNFLYVDQNYYLPDDILYKTDRMSMAHSLEVRPPFLDHRIVEFAARLPHELKIHGSSLKYVLRELMRDKLPQSVLTRRKEGFDIPAPSVASHMFEASA